MSGSFKYTSGPKDAKIALVGEAFGESEDQIGRPFVGQAGQELTRMLEQAEISRSDCFITNTFAFRPKNNKLDSLCGSKAEVGKDYPYTSLSNGKYLLPKYFYELARLHDELSIVKPNIIVTLGATSTWAMLNNAKITQIRGTCTLTKNNQKILPTYHPAFILLDWSYRVIAIADLMKAKRESEFPELRRPERSIYVSPTIEELEEWTEVLCTAHYLACDIETIRNQISMIGFAPSPHTAYCVPFIKKKIENYWQTPELELSARNCVQQILASRSVKIFQNGMFDLQYLAREGFRPTNLREDTMLRHHTLYPELQKGLGFLGSIYTNEIAWKEYRTKKDNTKSDDE